MNFLNIIITTAATMLLVSCNGENECKFNAKEYAERKTERLDKIVELDDKQEDEVFALYLAQGKQIQKDLKAMKKEGYDRKQPDARGPKAADCDKKANCPKVKGECPKVKGECPKVKGECPKAADCDKKANCPKVKGECPKVKGECPKAADCDKKANCPKVKGECPKAADCDKKANCPKVKGECPKAADCDKKANCPKVKGECPKAADCDKKTNCPKVKGECPKAADCNKKAECKKVVTCAKAPKCNKNAQCDRNGKNEYRHPRHPRHIITPESKKAFTEKLNSILTPQQQEILKQKRAAHMERKEQMRQTTNCCPAPTKETPKAK